MKEMTVINLAERLGPRMQGRLSGRQHFAVLCGLVSDSPPGEVVWLDFAGAEIVTGSWVNAALVPFMKWAADERHDLFPVIVNARPDWRDELELVAEWNHLCFLVGDGKVPPRRVALVGPLEPAQRATLIALLDLREATGAALERHRPDDGVRATAWNNRLKDLYEKRLLRRARRGREQVYSPVVREVVLDG